MGIARARQHDRYHFADADRAVHFATTERSAVRSTDYATKVTGLGYMDAAEHLDARSRILAVLSQLTRQEREAYAARAHGYSYEKIARHLGVRTANVRPMIEHARSVVTERLRELGYIEADGGDDFARAPRFWRRGE